RPHKQLDKCLEFLAADARGHRELVERVPKQIAERATQERRGQSPIAGERPKGEWAIETAGVLLREQRGAERIVITGQPNISCRGCFCHTLPYSCSKSRIAARRNLRSRDGSRSACCRN